MIIFNIVQSDKAKLPELSAYLMQKKYALQTHVDVNTIYTAEGTKETIRLFFVTKALLYSTIEQDVKNKFYTEDMVIYATPISHINEEHAALLRSGLSQT